MTNVIRPGQDCAGCLGLIPAVCPDLAGGGRCPESCGTGSCSLPRTRSGARGTEGAGGVCIHVIRSGVVNLVHDFEDGRRQILDFGFPGDLLCRLEDGPGEGWTVESRSPVELCEIDREAFDRGGHGRGGTLLAMAARAIAARNRHAAVLGRMRAEERVTSFLLDLSERTASDSLTLAFSRAEIADYLCLTKETVSRCLSQLRGAGVIAMSSPEEVEILDRAALRAGVARDPGEPER